MQLNKAIPSSTWPSDAQSSTLGGKTNHQKTHTLGLLFALGDLTKLDLCRQRTTISLVKYCRYKATPLSCHCVQSHNVTEKHLCFFVLQM